MNNDVRKSDLTPLVIGQKVNPNTTGIGWNRHASNSINRYSASNPHSASADILPETTGAINLSC